MSAHDRSVVSPSVALEMLTAVLSRTTFETEFVSTSALYGDTSALLVDAITATTTEHVVRFDAMLLDFGIGNVVEHGHSPDLHLSLDFLLLGLLFELLLDSLELLFLGFLELLTCLALVMRCD